MQEKQILQHTKQAVEQITPDCFDAIWERASKAGSNEYPLPTSCLTSKKEKRVAKRWIASVSVLVACILCFFGFRWYENYAVYSTINMDINPSIRISINRQKEILSITGLNADGEKVVSALSSPMHRPLYEVLTETILELVKDGYLTTNEANAILISVDMGNNSKAEELMEELSKEISSTMGEEKIYGEIISQQIPRDDKEVERIAKELHISNGKATLIRNMTSKNHNLCEKDLANMKIDEIVKTAKEERVDMNSFKQPARLQDVPAPKNSAKPNAVPENQEQFNKKENSENLEHIEDTNTNNKHTQNNSEKSKADSTATSGKQQKITEVPETTEQPKETAAPKSNGDKKGKDNQKQQNRKGLDEYEHRQNNPTREPSATPSCTATPNATTAPETTSVPDDRRRRPEVTHNPDGRREPDEPRYPRDGRKK